MPETSYTNYLDFAHQLLRAALPILKKNLENLTEAAKSQSLKDAVTWKADREVVTNGEQKAEQAMRELVEKQFPTHTIIGEETGVTLSDNLEFAWVFDPVDGTSAMLQTVNNIAQQITPEDNQKPHFGITIALVHNGVPVVSIIHDLDNDITWAGAKGQPTTRNGEVVTAPQPTEALQGARLASTVPFDLAGSPIMFQTPEQQVAFAAVQSAIAGQQIPTGEIGSLTITNRNCIGFVHLLEGNGVDIVWEGDLMYHDAAALVPILEGAEIKVTDENDIALNFAIGNVEKEFRIIAASETLHNLAIRCIADTKQNRQHTVTPETPRMKTSGTIDYSSKFSN